MGRCYEFGVAIDAACEHAMHVSPAGGQCECPTCGVTCDGRFGGCAAILAVPGYVPANGPTSPADDLPSDAPQPAAPANPPDDVDLDALRAEMRAYQREVREIVDAALATMTTMAVGEMRPLAASKLVGLRRRLAELRPSESASEPDARPTPN